MPCKAPTALIALLVFGFPSAVFAETNNRAGHHRLFVQRPVAMMSNSRTRPVDDAAKAFTAEDKGAFAASQLVPNVPFGRGGSSGGTKRWIKLTGASGEPVHINVEQVSSVRSDSENLWREDSTRFGEREISTREGKCRAGHAVDLGHFGRSGEWRNTKRSPNLHRFN